MQMLLTLKISVVIKHIKLVPTSKPRLLQDQRRLRESIAVDPLGLSRNLLEVSRSIKKHHHKDNWLMAAATPSSRHWNKDLTRTWWLLFWVGIFLLLLSSSNHLRASSSSLTPRIKPSEHVKSNSFSLQSHNSSCHEGQIVQQITGTGAYFKINDVRGRGI